MNKYYVATPFWRSLEENRAAFVEARTGSEAASKVLGGSWKVKNPDGVALADMAMVYRLDEKMPIDAGTKHARINSKAMRHYKRV